MNKTQINKLINNYCKANKISKKKYQLYPLYLHLNGFSHSIGFIDHKAKKNETEYNYTSVGYTAYTKECWGYANDHQRRLATAILSNIPHYTYQRQAQEILF